MVALEESFTVNTKLRRQSNFCVLFAMPKKGENITIQAGKQARAAIEFTFSTLQFPGVPSNMHWLYLLTTALQP